MGRDEQHRGAPERGAPRRFGTADPESAVDLEAAVALPHAFYARPAREVARELIGKVIVSDIGQQVAGRIVETEAYIGPEDPASHAAERIGRTDRNAAMFGPPARAYVYLSYGIHWCLNAVACSDGHPCGVLIRALEPLTGLPVMRRRRGTPDRDLTRGPGRLCQALGVTGELNGHRLDQPPLRFLDAPVVEDDAVDEGPRIGISKAVDWPLRFTLRGSRFLSR